MTIYETALKEIYAAYDQTMQDCAGPKILNLFAVITVQRMITGDPNEQKPVGLLGRISIQSVQDDIADANRSMKNWRNP